MRAIRRIGLIGLLLVALPAPVAAHLSTPDDPADTPGLFDIRRAGFGHKDGFIRLSATTEGPWERTILAEGVTGNDVNDNAFQFEIESRGDFHSDYVIVVDIFDDRLQGDLRRYVTSSETEHVRFVDAEKDGRTVKVKLRKRLVRPRDSYIGWSADSYFMESDRCSETQCIDYSPNGDILFTHRLR